MLIYIPMLYILIFPILLPYTVAGGYDVIFYLVFGTISTVVILSIDGVITLDNATEPKKTLN